MEGSAQYFRRFIPRYLFTGTGIPVTAPRTHSAARAHRRRRPLVRLAPRAAGRDAGTCYSTALIVEGVVQPWQSRLHQKSHPQI